MYLKGTCRNPVPVLESAVPLQDMISIVFFFRFVAQIFQKELIFYFNWRKRQTVEFSSDSFKTKHHKIYGTSTGADLGFSRGGEARRIFKRFSKILTTFFRSTKLFFRALLKH